MKSIMRMLYNATLCKNYSSQRYLLNVSARYLFLAVAMSGLATSLAGCGSGSGTWQKVTVEGAVTFDGKKVVNGDIRFVPTISSMGPTVGAEVIDGRYRVTNKGGVPVGTHRIMLRAFNIEGVGPASSGAGSGDLFGTSGPKQEKRSKPSIPVYMVEGYAQFLPPAYNKQMALTVEITGSENPQIEDFNMVSEER